MNKEILKAYTDDFAEMKFNLDPYRWVMYCFEWGKGELKDYPEGPDVWQKRILLLIRKRLMAYKGDDTQKEAFKLIRMAVASGHGIGKSALISMLILWCINTFEDTRGVVTANTETQLRTKTWPELIKWHNMCLTKEMFTVSATSIYSNSPGHDKTWRIDMIPWSENNTEAFAGLHNKGKRLLICFDEASSIADKIWEVTEGALTDKDTEIFWIVFGNPTRNVGRFRDCFPGGMYASRWYHENIDSRTAKATNKALLEEMIADKGLDSDFVKVRILGQFPSNSFEQFIPSDLISESMQRVLRYEQYDFSPVVITCDPAWSGNDDLIIAMRQGLYSRILKVIPKNENDYLIATMLANYETEYNASAVIIDAGYGTGILSAGKTMGRNWKIIWFNSASPDPAYQNMRSYMWGMLKQWLKEGGCLPKDDQLFSELSNIESHINPRTMKIQLESKETMKARGLSSPNKGDALALSFALPSTAVKRESQRFATYSTNPLARRKNTGDYGKIIKNPIFRGR